MAYSKRYPGGFLDLPDETTPVDQQFLNAVERALLTLFGQDASADGQVLGWSASGSAYLPALLKNANVDPAAAIAKSKLDLAGQITDADIAGAAAISASKIAGGLPVQKATAISSLMSGDGAAARLRLGTSPFQFIDLVYDATYSKWVSPEFLAAGIDGSSSRFFAASVAASSEIAFVYALVRAKEAIAAGLSLQARFTGEFASSAATTTASFSAHPLNAAIGSAPVPVSGTYLVLASTTAANDKTYDSGWLDVTGLDGTSELGGLSLLLRNTGGTVSSLQVAGNLYFRWVG